jgi:hypothetical protein
MRLHRMDISPQPGFMERIITNVTTSIEAPKPPRWINTAAGQQAWHTSPSWRSSALGALSVQERVRLLDEAERLYHRAAPTAAR